MLIRNYKIEVIKRLYFYLWHLIMKMKAMRSMKYLTILMLSVIFFSFTGCKTTQQQSVEAEEEQQMEVLTFRDEIVGDWKLLGLDEEIGEISSEEKEAYAENLDLLTEVYLLSIYGDGTYRKRIINGEETGRWRIVDGETGIELYPENGREEQYYIKEYSNPLLRLEETKEGEKRVFHLRRSEY